MSNKYSQKLVDTPKKSATDAIKTVSKRAIQKTAEATGDLVGNKIADKITSASKKSHNEKIQSNEVNNEIPKERYISPKERQQIIDELRLIIEYQKIANLIDDASNQLSKFRTKNWIEINYETYETKIHSMLIVKSSLKLQC